MIRHIDRSHVSRKILIVPSACAVLTPSIGCGLCGEELLSSHNSPDGRFVVVVYVRNCGATTPYVTHAHIRKATTQISADWDGAIREAEVLSIKGKYSVGVKWTAATLVVFEAPSELVIICTERLNDVAIKCVSPASDP
jgi:hypothetical protein